MNLIALIPARTGSKRVANKNFLMLNGHPLFSYSVQAAKDSGIFNGIYVSSDSQDVRELAERYGAEFIHCPLEIAHKDLDPDIKWVRHALSIVKCDLFSILRPTSPFRTGDTIKRAWNQFYYWPDAWQEYIDRPLPTSLRAVEKCRQHPYKMWWLASDRLIPFVEASGKMQLFNTPYQSLPEVYVQNASLEISWSGNVYNDDSISGNRIMPFLTEGYEGFDINNQNDVREAEWLVSQGAEMPKPEVVI